MLIPLHYRRQLIYEDLAALSANTDTFYMLDSIGSTL